MKLIAFDLVWDGITGWVYFNPELDDPIVRYGDFKPKLQGHKITGVARLQTLCRHLFSLCKETIDAFKTKDLIVVFEQSDWHQDLKRGDWKQAYARERMVQRTLGMAEASFMLAVDSLQLPLIGIGAAEAKREFGAVRKDAAARLLAAEYPRFTIREISSRDKYGADLLYGNQSDGYFIMFDSVTSELVPHHVSDAIVVAKVVAARLKMSDYSVLAD